MIIRKSFIFFAAAFAVAVIFVTPTRASAETYGEYVYYDGLPSDYKASDWEGYGFNVSTYTSTSPAQQRSLSATSITIGSEVYVCTGWKYGFGIDQEEGAGDSVTYTGDHDVSVTWIYGRSAKLTVKIDDPQISLWGWGSRAYGRLGDNTTSGSITSPENISELRSYSSSGPHIDFNSIYGGSNRLAYAFTWVYAPSQRSAKLKLGSDDSVVVWLNNAKIHSNPVARVATSDSDVVDVTLNSGWNKLLFKVIQGSVGWGFYCRFTNTSGADMTDLDVSTAAPEHSRDYDVDSNGYIKNWILLGPYAAAGATDITTSYFDEANYTPHIGGGPWMVLSAGQYLHAAAIKSDGSLWAWGMNAYGQVGNGNADHIKTPILVDTGPFIDVAAGAGSTGAIKADGSLWTWGQERYGQLGDNTSSDSNRYRPQKVGTELTWRSISAGWNYYLAVRENGSLWAWGSNPDGRLGDNSTSDRLAPVRIGDDNDWSIAVAGYYNSAGIKKDGSLWVWGPNAFGQVGDGTNTTRKEPRQIMPGSKWKAVSLGHGLTVAVRQDGTLWTWGNNGSGQLGLGVSGNKSSPHQVGSDTDWRSVAGGDGYALAIKTDGTLWSWGGNGEGQLGYGTTSSKSVPTRVGTERNWITVSVPSASGGVSGGEASSMALRGPYSYEVTPFLGGRDKVAGDSFAITAKAIPSNGGEPFYISNWKDGYGDVTPATGSSPRAEVKLTTHTGLTWVVGAGDPVLVNVSFPTGVPDDVQKDPDVFPPLGNNMISRGSLTLTAPRLVTLSAGSEWECSGYAGTGDVPVSGTDCRVQVNLASASSIIWKYRKVPTSGVTFSFSVMQSGTVTNSDADFALFEPANTPGEWNQVSPDGSGRTKLFEPNLTIKLTSKLNVTKGGTDSFCTGLSVNTPGQYVIQSVESGDRKEFLIPLSSSGTGTVAAASSLDVSVIYSQSQRVPLGTAVPLPQNCIAYPSQVKDRVTLISPGHPADNKENAFFYTTGGSYAFYPVRPVTLFSLTCDGTSNAKKYYYYANWPDSYSRDGVVVNAPANLQPAGSAYKYETVHYSESWDYGQWIIGSDNVFQPPRRGRTMVRFSKEGAPYFVSVNAVDPAPVSTLPWVMGSQVTPPSGLHDDPEGKNGYVYYPNAYYDGAGSDAAYDRAARSGDIIPVNRNISGSADRDLVVVWYQRGAAGPAAEIGWPTAPYKYEPAWNTTNKIVIASGNGSGPLTEAQLKGSVYKQPDDGRPGFNPNEEHAIILGNVLYALRDDLNRNGFSEPYVLLKFNDPVTSKWTMTLYQVVDEDETYKFTYTAVAGSPVTPLTPMDLLPQSGSSRIMSGSGETWHFEDHKGRHWAKAANTLTGDQKSKFIMQWYYPLQKGFYYPDQSVREGDPVTFLGLVEPRDVTYVVNWPEPPYPTLPIGETLTSAKFGLPDIASMATVSVIFDEIRSAGTSSTLAVLYSPFTERSAPLSSTNFPAGIKTETKSGKKFFTDLPYALRSRLYYDMTAQKLIFKGVSIDTGTGEPLLLTNVMSQAERDRIVSLITPTDSSWQAKVNSLYDAAKRPTADEAPMALSAGRADGEGFVVLAENNDPALGSAPVALHVIRVEGGPYQGEVKVIKSDNPFDEKLTLRHSGDFGGEPGRFHFAWYYRPDQGVVPALPRTAADTAGWVLHMDGKGLSEVTIEGPGKFTLSDNWFMVHYYYGDDPATAAADAVYPSLATAHTPTVITNVKEDENNWSRWAGAPGGDTAQLAEGWIKRVTNELNPLDARVDDFRNNETNTTVSMISQIGERYEGDIALNGSPENLNNIGLIEAYQTVLERGQDYSIDAPQPSDYGPADKALLNAATRIADFYTLLGNESYNDAQDPTVGYDSQSGQTGFMASSIFAFQNQLGSLLEEELTLLQGRDDTMSTVKAPPVYNRLIWNFTNGDGETAYVQTYNVGDYDMDGFINEADAKLMYPQGHGDAWGHYLTAMKTWYGLLRHPLYTWEPQTEAILVGSSPVPVDYLDERKFARAAAYKAQAGAEIVDLTYRQLYVEDPAGEWQGYKDNRLVTLPTGSTAARAWGLDEWARRAGQGAYFDWVTANAMLPAEDKLHTGIQKIDRTTVPELRQIASEFQTIQAKADQADAGLNPLGLARGVVPFDIDPNMIAASGVNSQSHFEQIYGRAVTALENARTVYDYASQYTQMIRGNEDSLEAFRKRVADQERDNLNRLIEIFGYPYTGDIGPGKTYPAGYDGPDLLHFNYMDVPALTGLAAYGGSSAGNNTNHVAMTFTFDFRDFSDVDNGFDKKLSLDDIGRKIDYQLHQVTFPMDIDGPWSFVAPSDWGARRAPGEIQMALAELIKAESSYRQGLLELQGIYGEMDAGVNILKARYKTSAANLDNIWNADATQDINEGFAHGLKEVEIVLQTSADFAEKYGDATAEFFPQVVGLANDVTSPARGATKLTSTTVMGASILAVNVVKMVEERLNFDSANIDRELSKDLAVNDAHFEMYAMAQEFTTMEGNARIKIQELFTLEQEIVQALGVYQAALAKGERLLNERETLRMRTAGEIQDYRYQDLSFRTFRNDAIQKYRASFDLASRYAYLAATAYDYETNLLRSDKASGANFLTELAKQRSPGVIVNGVPVVGKAGLADPMARLNQNFGVYKTQLGFNNPQTETNPFSLRTELFRIRPDSDSDAAWKAELGKYWKNDLNKVDSFKRFCRPFAPDNAGAQPGLVIPFSTAVKAGRNFFDWPLGSGDSAYDPSHFATKVRSVGVWFKGYNSAGLSNTPRVYLVPAGADVLRAPSGDGFEERMWRVVDQKLPAPFPVSTEEIASESFIPMNDSLSEDFGGLRRFSSFRAYNDPGDVGTGPLKTAEMNTDSRLVGRSVWNSNWLLIIPGGSLYADPESGLMDFVDTVKDIRLFFQTYSYSGN